MKLANVSAILSKLSTRYLLPALVVVLLSLTVYHCQRAQLLQKGEEKLRGELVTAQLESDGWHRAALAKPKEVTKWLSPEVKERAERAVKGGAELATTAHVETQYVEVPFGPCTRDPDLESIGGVEVTPHKEEPLKFNATVDALMTMVPNAGVAWQGKITATFLQGDLSDSVDLPLDEARTHVVMSGELHKAIELYQRRRSKWLPRPFVGGGVVLSPTGDVRGGLVAGYGWSF